MQIRLKNVENAHFQRVHPERHSWRCSRVKRMRSGSWERSLNPVCWQLASRGCESRTVDFEGFADIPGSDEGKTWWFPELLDHQISSSDEAIWRFKNCPLGEDCGSFVRLSGLVSPHWVTVNPLIYMIHVTEDTEDMHPPHRCGNTCVFLCVSFTVAFHHTLASYYTSY